MRKKYLVRRYAGLSAALFVMSLGICPGDKRPFGNDPDIKPALCHHLDKRPVIRHYDVHLQRRLRPFAEAHFRLQIHSLHPAADSRGLCFQPVY